MNLQEIEERVAQLDLSEGPTLIHSLLSRSRRPISGRRRGPPPRRCSRELAAGPLAVRKCTAAQAGPTMVNPS
ncbi:MAG: hypothetical protein WKF96_21305 [Solirubrobacteraceae bacterium]